MGFNCHGRNGVMKFLLKKNNEFCFQVRTLILTKTARFLSPRDCHDISQYWLEQTGFEEFRGHLISLQKILCFGWKKVCTNVPSLNDASRLNKVFAHSKDLQVNEIWKPNDDYTVSSCSCPQFVLPLEFISGRLQVIPYRVYKWPS